MTWLAATAKPQRRFLLQIGVLLIVAGLAAIGLELANHQATVEEFVLARARAHFRDIVLTRRWAAGYGGVYVEKREGIEANPYLENPDIVADNGKTYTLRNPALMTREISELAASEVSELATREGDYRFHITSLNLKNPANAADDWERAALEAFAGGDKERFTTVHNGKLSEFRYMAPLLVEQACMKCHQGMGYRVGDVRGGISVRFDITPLMQRRQQHAWIIGLAAVLMLAGLFSLASVFATRMVRRLQILSKRHEDLVQSIDGIVWEADAKTFQFTFVSAQAERLLGFPLADWEQADFWVNHLHPDERTWAHAYRASCTDRQASYDLDYRFVDSDGKHLWLRDRVRVIAENDEASVLRGLTFDVTREHAQNEQTQRLLVERETILDNALVGITYLKHRRVVSCNRRLEEIFGYDPGELLGQSTERLYPSRAAFEAIGERAYANCGAGRNHCEELLLRRKSGEIFWGALNGQAIDPAHPQEGSIWIYTDISERRAAEEEAHKLLRAVEQSPVSIVITDRDGLIEYVNPRFSQVTGYRANEAIGQNPRLLQSGCTSPETYQEMWDALLAGREWRGILCNRRKNGELFWEEASLSPIIDEHGTITHFLGVKEDITERKRRDDELRRSHALLDLTGRIGRIGGWAWDVASETLTWTDEVFRIRDLEPGRTPGLAEALSYYAPGSRPLIQAAIDSALCEGSPWDLELEMITATGRSIWVHSQGRAERVQGKTVRLDGAFQEITEQRRVKLQLEEYQQHLEEVVERRTADLARALEAAKVADRVKDSFLANVSHELRTPLNAVIGLSALALNSSTEPRQREYLEKVSDAGQTLLAIINDLLDLTKIAAGEMTFEATPFSLRKTAARALSVLGHHAAEKGLPLSVHIDERIPEVLIGDPLRIEQILLNLLNNAIKFTDSGHIVVRITLESCDEQRARLLLEVEDSGIGMSDDEIAHIYQPFVQADPSITRKHGGTGLGLAICRQLAEGMHGSIEVSSRPGEGTVFRVRLTLGCAPAGALPSGEESADGESLPNHYREAQVLVVDDQALNREIVFDLLGTVGIVPRLAENGQVAIDILTAAGAPAFDLVLMDIQMPVLDGLAATRRIRALPGFATLPIVAMTAHTMVHEKQVYFAEGMNDHLGKPFSLPNFFALLARWLAHRVAPLPTIAGPPCAASDGGDLPNIVGLDSRAAMQRFAGNQARYRHWLGEFVGESASFVATLEALLASGAHEAARQATHAFRGRVGVLGMRELHRQATALEQAIRTGRDCDALRQQLAGSIVTMCGQVQAALQPSPRTAMRWPTPPLPAPRPASPPPASITALLQLLDTADGNSAAAIQRCLDEFSDSPWQPLLLAALTEVQRFDFEAARQCLADPGNGPIQ